MRFKKTLPLLALVLFPACSSSYRDATRSDYIGNNQFEITSSGNEFTTETQVRRYLYRKAFETCSVYNHGFRIITQENISTRSTAVRTDYDGDPVVETRYLPGVRMIVECSGDIDRALEAQVRREQLSDR